MPGEGKSFTPFRLRWGPGKGLSGMACDGGIALRLRCALNSISSSLRGKEKDFVLTELGNAIIAQEWSGLQVPAEVISACGGPPRLASSLKQAGRDASCGPLACSGGAPPRLFFNLSGSSDALSHPPLRLSSKIVYLRLWLHARCRLSAIVIGIGGGE